MSRTRNSHNWARISPRLWRINVLNCTLSHPRDEINNILVPLWMRSAPKCRRPCMPTLFPQLLTVVVHRSLSCARCHSVSPCGHRPDGDCSSPRRRSPQSAWMPIADEVELVSMLERRCRRSRRGAKRARFKLTWTSPPSHCPKKKQSQSLAPKHAETQRSRILLQLPSCLCETEHSNRCFKK